MVNLGTRKLREPLNYVWIRISIVSKLGDVAPNMEMFSTESVSTVQPITKKLQNSPTLWANLQERVSFTQLLLTLHGCQNKSYGWNTTASAVTRRHSPNLFRQCCHQTPCKVLTTISQHKVPRRWCQKTYSQNPTEFPCNTDKKDIWTRIQMLQRPSVNNLFICYFNQTRVSINIIKITNIYSLKLSHDSRV